MTRYSNFTDAELRALFASGIGDDEAYAEATERFCDTVRYRDMRNSLDQAEGLMALIESQVVTVNACLDEIKDALQRATE